MGLLRSLAFGATLILATLSLLLANLGMWALVATRDLGTFERIGANVLDRPEVRSLLARRLAERLAPVVVSLGTLDEATRSALGVPARPTVGEAETALRLHLEAWLARPDALADLAPMLDDIQAQLRARIATGGSDDVLSIDLDALVGRYAVLLDPGGGLARRIPVDLGRLPVVEGAPLERLTAGLGVLDMLRWILPIACGIAMAGVLVLARFRLHALAWIGLACVVAGTVSLLLASGAPLVAPRLMGADSISGLALGAALEAITAGLVVQSAVLAVIGLALVVVGIAAATVTTDRKDPVMVG